MSLTRRQEDVLDYINNHIKIKGYPPSVREIGKALGIASSATVHRHLSNIESKGYIRKDPTKSRSIEVINNGGTKAKMGKGIPVPLIEIFVQGQTVFQTIKEYFMISEQLIDVPIEDKLFLFQAKGDHMLNFGILNGDYVLAREQQVVLNGELVVIVSRNNQPMIKKFFKTDEGILLTDEETKKNGTIHEDIYIVGKVIGVHRKVNTH